MERLAAAVKRSVSGGQPWQLLVTGTIMGQLKVGAGNRYNGVGVGVRGGKSGDLPQVLSWDSSRWGKGRCNWRRNWYQGRGQELGCPGGATASKRILRSREGFIFGPSERIAQHNMTAYSCLLAFQQPSHPARRIIRAACLQLLPAGVHIHSA